MQRTLKILGSSLKTGSFEEIDYFGVQPQLLISHKKQFFTKYGAIATILVFGVFIFTIIYQSKDMIFHQNPMINNF